MTVINIGALPPESICHTKQDSNYDYCPVNGPEFVRW